MSENEDGDWDDCEFPTGAEEDANILANTPLLALAPLPLEVEEPLAAVVANPAAAGLLGVSEAGCCCTSAAGLTGASVTRNKYQGEIM